MQRVSVKLEEEMVEHLDELAEEHGVTRSDVIRDTLDDGLNTDDDEEIQRLRSELEDLERENERLQRQLVATNKRVEEHTELVEYVEEERSWRSAGLGTRIKWWMFGRDE